MRTSLNEYTIGEIEKMKDVEGTANYDAYDKIMYNICFELDEITMADEIIKTDSHALALVKQLNFFVMSFVANKKMRLTDVEQVKLRQLINVVDKEALSRPKTPTFKAYNEFYRRCMLEFLDRSAHFKLNEPSKKIIR